MPELDINLYARTAAIQLLIGSLGEEMKLDLVAGC